MSNAQDQKFLELLSEKYPTIQAVCTEIINLNAILNLPKGTEHFISDIHGEDEAFCHILNNASGVIREKVDILYSKTADSETRTELCTLIYYPSQKIKELKKKTSNLREWYMITLYRLVEVCRLVASKYTRSKVRKALPADFAYILEELLSVNNESDNKQSYYDNIIAMIIDTDRADAFIDALSGVIKRLTVDRLHVLGDIFDRGPHADVILDRLMNHHSVDIQWGNHDILWMGAAAGSDACIANVLNITTRYNNMDFVENAYGINLRPLALFAQTTYMDNSDIISNMHHAIAIIQFKLEGQLIKRHPEYNMEERLLLDKIDLADGTVRIGDAVHTLNNAYFPTIDSNDPYALTPEEQEIVAQLNHSFTHSEKLTHHIRFLYSQGSMYKITNGNVIFHGCIPMNEDGSFYEFTDGNVTLSCKEFLDYADLKARRAYYAHPDDADKQDCLDFMWYLWCGSRSPLFGRDRMTSFERIFIDDQSTWTETKNPYYELSKSKEVCEKILAEFDLSDDGSRIINGHVPVRVKEGEFPIRGDGKLLMIDGGFSRAYQPTTGIAGYTMFFNSYGIRLVSHHPFTGLADAIHKNTDILSTHVVYDTARKRITVRETDVGRELSGDISDLQALLTAYRKGIVKEKNRTTV